MAIRLNPVTTSSPPLSPRSDDERAQFSEACETLQEHFDTFDGWFDDGTMDMNELYSAERGERGPELQKAAEFFVAHPEYLKELDAAGDGSRSGSVSLEEVKTQIGRLSREQQLQQLGYDPRLPELRRAVDAFAQNWDALETAGGGLWADGRMSEQDLKAVLNDPAKYPNQELRDAAAFFLHNPDLMGTMDVAAHGGGADGIVSREDLDVFSRQLSGVQSSLPTTIKPPLGDRY